MKTKESFSAYRIAWVVVATLCFITVAYATNVIVWTSWKLICWPLLSMASAVVLAGWLAVAIKFWVRNKGISIVDLCLIVISTAYFVLFWWYLIN